MKWKAETIINENNIGDVVESVYGTIILNIQNLFEKARAALLIQILFQTIDISKYNIDSVIDHAIIISKYNPIAGSSYIKLPTELNHPKKVWFIFKILMIMNPLNGV